MKYCGFGCGCQNSCGYPRMRSSDTPLVIMDTKAEEEFSLILEAEEKLKDSRKSRSVLVRKQFQIRYVMGEFHTSFQHLINKPDEMLFFNYMRMSHQITGI